MAIKIYADFAHTCDNFAQVYIKGKTDMSAIKTFLVLMLITLIAYTAMVIESYGLNLFPYFFGDMAELTWGGQFNLDFMFMLALSALWVAWRNQFSGAGLGLAVLAFFGGALFLGVYLLHLIKQESGDAVRILIGSRGA